MIQYHKMITLRGDVFVKEYESIKHHKNKTRYLREETVAESFKKGDVEIIIHFEENDKIITINDFSSEDLVRTFLGPKFLKR